MAAQYYSGGILLNLFSLSCAIFVLLLMAPPPCCKASTEFVLYSNPTTALVPGQNFSYDMTPLGLPYGPASLVMQHDCNLVSHFRGKQSWASNTTGAAENCYLTVNNYGQAFIRGNYNYPVWSSPAIAPNVSGDYVFILQWNGDLGIFGSSIWSSTNKEELANPALSTNTTDYVVYTGSVMIRHIAKYKEFELDLEPSCNLILRRTDTGKVLWQSHKYSDAGDCFVTLDGNGELFVKHRRREILWRSNTRSTPGSYVLVLRYDARLVIYGPEVWNSKTKTSSLARRHRSIELVAS